MVQVHTTSPGVYLVQFRWARSKRRLKNYKRFGPQFIFFYLSGRGDRPFLACLSKEKKDKKSMLQEAMSCLECNLLCDTKRVLDQHVYMMHSLDKSKIGLSQFTTKCFHCKKVSFMYIVHSWIISFCWHCNKKFILWQNF